MANAAVIFTVDRIEYDEHHDAIAVLVLDDGQQLNLPLDRLPVGTKEGTVLKVSFDVDEDVEVERRREIRRLQARLFGRCFQTRD